MDNTWTCKVADFGLGYFKQMQKFHSSVPKSHRDSSERMCNLFNYFDCYDHFHQTAPEVQSHLCLRCSDVEMANLM